MRHSVIFSVVLVLVLASAGLFVWVSTKAADGRLLKPDNGEVVALGKKLYTANCASCHGASLQGEPNWRKPKPDLTMPAPPHDRTGHTWHHTDHILFDLTKYGLGKFLKNPGYKSNMPAYEGQLSDAEIVAVLSYIKSTWPEDIRQRHDQMNRQRAKASPSNQ